MKPLVPLVILIMVAGSVSGEEQTNRGTIVTKEKVSSALQKTKLSGNISIITPVDMFIKDVTARPCDVAYAEIDFGKDAPPVVILTGLRDPDKWNLYPWTFFEFRKDHWVKPKIQDPDGSISNDGGVDFDHTNAGNVYVEKFKRKGILSYNRELRFGYFTYLDPSRNILKTVHFLKPSEIGIKEVDLVKLRDSAKLDIKHRLLK
jgi:hypothetical protein